MLGLNSDPLAIYLNDHFAGSTFGAELARRAASQNEGTAYGRFLSKLAEEIEEDRRDLEAIMDRAGVGRDRVKTTAAWVAEKAGRLKANGRIVGYSPLSRVLELEGLRMGVHGKLALWQNLHQLAPLHPALEQRDLTRLRKRAERQLEQLREQESRAARDAFEQG
jgi:hypothetical protein